MGVVFDRAELVATHLSTATKPAWSSLDVLPWSSPDVFPWSFLDQMSRWKRYATFQQSALLCCHTEHAGGPGVNG
jgi:hypothetical protein